MKRSLRYVEAGADCILIHSKSNEPEEIVEFVSNWKNSTPLVLVLTAYPSLTAKAIEELGKVKLFIYANQPLRAAIKAQEVLLEETKRVGAIHTTDGMMVPVSRVFELQGVLAMKENEKRYLV